MSWETERLEKAKRIIEMYPQKRSALGPLLYLAQDKDGYISNESIVEISELVGITEVQVPICSFFLFNVQTRTNRKILTQCL